MNAAVRQPALRALHQRWLEEPRAISSAVLLVAVAGIAGTMAWLMEHGSYDTWAAIPVALGLILVSIPMLRRAVILEDDPIIARLLWWAFSLKLLAALPRYVVAFDVYDGQADAAAYSRVGSELARQFRDGIFVFDIGRPVQGTGFVQILTGFVYSVIGATSIGGFLVFSWMGFWGLYLFHRAFVRACPVGDHRRYALLVFLLPSLLFWPSSIGKEAWMCLGLGVVAYAASRLLTGARGGLALLGLGCLGLGMVRPHVAALVGFSVLLAYLLRRPPVGSSILAPIGKLLVILLLGAGMVLAVGQLESFFGVDDFDQDAVQSTLDEVSRRTGQGGSQFNSPSSTDLNPSRFPEAFVGVMFRPFPWEATNLQSLIAAAESLFLMGLFLLGWRRIVNSVRSAIHTPYVVLCCTYTVLFVYGFSAFSNAGILVRQRVQVLPFVLIVICLPPARLRRHDPGSSSVVESKQSDQPPLRIR